MKQDKADILIIKLLENRISKEESEALTKWLESEGHLDYFNRYVEIHSLLNQQSFDYKKSLKQAQERISKSDRKRRLNVFYKYAALLIIALGVGYFLLNQGESSNTSVATENNRKTNHNKAVLTLDDGSEITLQQGKAFRTKNIQSTGEKLLYEDSAEEVTSEIAYNYLTLPRGSQFFVKLEDGTRVWLNSESKLKYPVNFQKGKPRKVELLYGEAYFDVSPSTAHEGATFRVKSGEQEIEVLGTQFNVKAYKDEVIDYTTLVDGQIALNVDDLKTILKPGQQAVLDTKNGKVEVNEVEVFNEISWKDGIFSFKDKPLPEIMKILSRWYDVGVIYKQPQVKRIRFTGNLGKEQSLEDILLILCKTSELKYTINENQIIFE